MDYLNFLNWFDQWHPPLAIPPQGEAIYTRGNLYATEKSSDNGVAAVENAVYFFARSEENSIVPTAQDGSERIGVDTEAGYERPDYTRSHSVLTDTVDNVLNVYGIDPGLQEYGSYGSSVSFSASPGVNSLRSHDAFNSDFLSSPSEINSPTSEGAYPSSASSAESPYASPNNVLGTWDPDSGSTSEGPRYLNSLARPYDNAVNNPSNASLPHDNGTPSTTYSCLSSALGNLVYGEEERTVDVRQEEQGPDSSAGQDASIITIFPAENNNIDNINLEQTGNEQSDWAVNSLHEEGIVNLTNKFDHDTGAGPSTGSSVAAAMLDIGHAQHSRSRDDGAAMIMAAQEEPMGKGKRRAVDAPELPPRSKKARLEPPAQMMLPIIICSWPTPEFPVHLENFNQRDATKIVYVSPTETASGGERLLSLLGRESTCMTLVQEKSGELKARSMVSARDSHAPRPRVQKLNGNQ